MTVPTQLHVPTLVLNFNPTGAAEFFAFVIESELECVVAGALATTAVCEHQVPLGSVQYKCYELYLQLSLQVKY